MKRFMTKLWELCKEPVKRPRDSSHYHRLLEVWRDVRCRWPENPSEAGQESLLWATAAAFFYKGQTDYPDGEDAVRLVQLLTCCRQLDPSKDEGWEAVLSDLDRLPGVGIPRASVLLHCLFPEHFAIVDQKAAGALCGWAERGVGWPRAVSPPGFKPGEMTQDGRAYLDYRRTLLELVAISGRAMTLRDVELALYLAGPSGEAITGL